MGENYFTFSVKLVYLHRDSDPIKAINIAPCLFKRKTLMFKLVLFLEIPICYAGSVSMLIIKEHRVGR